MLHYEPLVNGFLSTMLLETSHLGSHSGVWHSALQSRESSWATDSALDTPEVSRRWLPALIEPKFQIGAPPLSIANQQMQPPGLRSLSDSRIISSKGGFALREVSLTIDELHSLCSFLYCGGFERRDLAEVDMKYRTASPPVLSRPTLQTSRVRCRWHHNNVSVHQYPQTIVHC
jgi:hypothetical protein